MSYLELGLDLLELRDLGMCGHFDAFKLILGRRIRSRKLLLPGILVAWCHRRCGN